MRRRGLHLLLGAATLATSRLAVAQQSERLRRIGVLFPFAESDPDARAPFAAFREELRHLGWTEGRNVHLDVRWAAGDLGRVPALAQELVTLRPDLIFARATPVIAALLRETTSIPIVFAVVSDPVGDGFVASLGRPGGNVTGFTNVESSLGGKWLELLKEIAPGVARVGIVSDPVAAPAGGSYYLRAVEPAASALAVVATPLSVRDTGEIERAIIAFAATPNGGLIVPPDVTTIRHRAIILELAARRRLPAIFPYRFIVAEGGLISYGIDVADLYRRAASYVDRILKGDSPAHLPVQGPTKFELAINLKTARALGLAVPGTLLARADEVIE